MSYTWKKRVTAPTPILSAAAARAAAAAGPKTTGYVPPAKREAEPKPFEEEFPTLVSTTLPSTSTQKPTLNFGEMMKATAAGAVVSAVPSREKIYISGNTRLRVIDDDEYVADLPTPAVSGIVGSYLARIRAREIADLRSRRRIFDSSSEEEPQPEVPDTDSFNDSDSDWDGQEEEGADTYDATAFDRHRHN